jgi:hypothetical protein
MVKADNAVPVPDELALRECLQNTNSRKRNAVMAVHFKVL